MNDEIVPNHRDQEGRKTGPWSEADSHGGITSGVYVDGERHGAWRHQFVDGSLRSEGEYDHGTLHGAWTWFRASGGLLQRGEFFHDEKHGRWDRWKADGTPLDSTEWDHGKKLRPQT
jgi:antitoxin component YwqK of YwqJK toxin-antitoxin module